MKYIKLRDLAVKIVLIFSLVFISIVVKPSFSPSMSTHASEVITKDQTLGKKDGPIANTTSLANVTPLSQSLVMDENMPTFTKNEISSIPLSNFSNTCTTYTQVSNANSLETALKTSKCIEITSNITINKVGVFADISDNRTIISQGSSPKTISINPNPSCTLINLVLDCSDPTFLKSSSGTPSIFLKNLIFDYTKNSNQSTTESFQFINTLGNVTLFDVEIKSSDQTILKDKNFISATNVNIIGNSTTLSKYSLTGINSILFNATGNITVINSSITGSTTGTIISGGSSNSLLESLNGLVLSINDLLCSILGLLGLCQISPSSTNYLSSVFVTSGQTATIHIQNSNIGAYAVSTPVLMTGSNATLKVLNSTVSLYSLISSIQTTQNSTIIFQDSSGEIVSLGHGIKADGTNSTIQFFELNNLNTSYAFETSKSPFSTPNNVQQSTLLSDGTHFNITTPKHVFFGTRVDLLNSSMNLTKLANTDGEVIESSFKTNELNIMGAQVGFFTPSLADSVSFANVKSMSRIAGNNTFTSNLSPNATPSGVFPKNASWFLLEGSTSLKIFNNSNTSILGYHSFVNLKNDTTTTLTFNDNAIITHNQNNQTISVPAPAILVRDRSVLNWVMDIGSKYSLSRTSLTSTTRYSAFDIQNTLSGVTKGKLNITLNKAKMIIEEKSTVGTGAVTVTPGVQVTDLILTDMALFKYASDKAFGPAMDILKLASHQSAVSLDVPYEHYNKVNITNTNANNHRFFSASQASTTNKATINVTYNRDNQDFEYSIFDFKAKGLYTLNFRSLTNYDPNINLKIQADDIDVRTSGLNAQLQPSLNCVYTHSCHAGIITSNGEIVTNTSIAAEQTYPLADENSLYASFVQGFSHGSVNIETHMETYLSARITFFDTKMTLVDIDVEAKEFTVQGPKTIGVTLTGSSVSANPDGIYTLKPDVFELYQYTNSNEVKFYQTNTFVNNVEGIDSLVGYDRVQMKVFLFDIEGNLDYGTHEISTNQKNFNRIGTVTFKVLNTKYSQGWKLELCVLEALSSDNHLISNAFVLVDGSSSTRLTDGCQNRTLIAQSNTVSPKDKDAFGNNLTTSSGDIKTWQTNDGLLINFSTLENPIGNYEGTIRYILTSN